MSETKYFSNEDIISPFPVVGTASREATYHELSSPQSALQPNLDNFTSGPRRSTRKKDMKSKMARRCTTSIEVTGDSKQRYEATLNFLRMNNLLDVTMKTVELEKRNAMIEKKMDQLRAECIKPCNA